MRILVILGIIGLVSACVSEPKEKYPYGMNEKEWNELSIKDKAAIRRDFYFVEKGNMNFVNRDLTVEGKKEAVPYSPKMTEADENRNVPAAEPEK